LIATLERLFEARGVTVEVPGDPEGRRPVLELAQESLEIALAALQDGNDRQAELSTAGALYWLMFNRGHRRLHWDCGGGQFLCGIEPGEDEGEPAREWSDHVFVE
jgi:hypothetical protein